MDHCNGASAYVLRAVISAERQEIIVNVERFVKLMTGHFDNKEQFTEMKEAGKIFPYAQHVNPICPTARKERGELQGQECLSAV